MIPEKQIPTETFSYTIDKNGLVDAETLRRRRQELGYSQSQLAKISGLSRSTIAGLELGKNRRVSAGTQRLLYSALQIDKFLHQKPSERSVLRDCFEGLLPPQNLAYDPGAGDYFLGVFDAEPKLNKRADGRTEHVATGGVPIGTRDERHIMTVAGSRAGKGRSVIIPNLLSYPGSMIVIDPKGEYATVSSRFRAEELGQNVCVLDPFEITAEHCAPYRKGFNPMTLLGNVESSTLVEDAELIADALVECSDSNEIYWAESARKLIAAVLLHLATDNLQRTSRPETTLVTLSEMLFGKWISETSGKLMDIKVLLAEMAGNNSLNNHISSVAQSLDAMPVEQRDSIIHTTLGNLGWLNFQGMQSVLSSHDFDLEDLKVKPTTIYLVLPALRINSCNRWLRLFVNLTLASVERVKTRPKIPVVMVLDELQALGRMELLEAAIQQIAGSGLRLHCVLQDLDQFRQLYNDRYAMFLANSGILQFFGYVDDISCDLITKSLANTVTWNSNHSKNTSWGKNESSSRGYSQSDTRSISHSGKTKSISLTSSRSSGISYGQSTNLATKGEIGINLARNDVMPRQIILTPEREACVLQRAFYDQHELFAGRFDARP